MRSQIIYIWYISLNRVWHSSSSCRAASTDIPDPFSPPLSIVHCFRQVLRATSRILTELLYVGSSWSSRFSRLFEGVHRSTSLMSSSLLLQQCPACLVRLTWIVFVMGGRWPYSWCFVGCCLQAANNIEQVLEVWYSMTHNGWYAIKTKTTKLFTTFLLTISIGFFPR